MGMKNSTGWYKLNKWLCVLLVNYTSKTIVLKNAITLILKIPKLSANTVPTIFLNMPSHFAKKVQNWKRASVSTLTAHVKKKCLAIKSKKWRKRSMQDVINLKSCQEGHSSNKECLLECILKKMKNHRLYEHIRTNKFSPLTGKLASECI